MAKKTMLNVQHSIPGRVRLKFEPGYAGVPNLDKFLEIEGVDEVTFDRMTKSVLIQYEEGVPVCNIFEGVTTSFKNYKVIKSDSSDNCEENVYSNFLSKIIGDSAGSANRKVNRRTNGYADLGSLVPMALFMTGIGRLATRPVLPNWYDFIWYGYNTFLHFNPPKDMENSSNGKKNKKK